MFRKKISRPVESPVLAVDALGVGERIRNATSEGLEVVCCHLNRQYRRFRSKIPFRLVIETSSTIFGTSEFSTFRLNDMFVLYSPKPVHDPVFTYLIAGSLLYHQLLLERFIPRGGLGFGLVLADQNSILGSGFIDAYDASERRPDQSKDICAIRLSTELVARIPNSEKAQRLICFYNGAFYLHPFFLADPAMGQFSPDRILELLGAAGADALKTEATRKFLFGLEDYDAAKLRSSESRRLLELGKIDAQACAR